MSAHVLLSVHLASEETCRLENFLAAHDDNALTTEQVRDGLTVEQIAALKTAAP